MKSKSRLVFFNNKFIPEDEAKVSIYDSSLMFGDMVFEMTRSFNKKHFKLKEHIDRLFLGLKILRIDPKMSKSEILAAAIKTAKINEHLFSKDDPINLEHKKAPVNPTEISLFQISSEKFSKSVFFLKSIV